MCPLAGKQMPAEELEKLLSPVFSGAQGLNRSLIRRRKRKNNLGFMPSTMRCVSSWRQRLTANRCSGRSGGGWCARWLLRRVKRRTSTSDSGRRWLKQANSMNANKARKAFAVVAAE